MLGLTWSVIETLRQTHVTNDWNIVGIFIPINQFGV